MPKGRNNVNLQKFHGFQVDLYTTTPWAGRMHGRGIPERPCNGIHALHVFLLRGNGGIQNSRLNFVRTLLQLECMQPVGISDRVYYGPSYNVAKPTERNMFNSFV